MPQRTRLDLAEIEKYYRIEPDGRVWSYKHERYLYQTPSMCGYMYVSLYPARTMTSVHKLVAQKFIGDCPAGCEISHKDGDKNNNHYSNLEYISHSTNILKSFSEHGRPAPTGNPWPRSTRQKRAVAEANRKPVYASDGREWPSVKACSEDIGKSRVAIYDAIRDKRELRGVGAVLSYSPADAKNQDNTNN